MRAIEETKRKRFPSTPTGKIHSSDGEKLSVVENIIELRDEIDDWRASYLSGRLNISNGRNFHWMRTKFAKWKENLSIGSLTR